MKKINKLFNKHNRLKLWFAYANTDNWGGLTKYCCIAETKEEAEAKMGLAPYKENPRYFVREPYEMTGRNILTELVTCGGTDGIELIYTINQKEKES